ncbi:MULTISPECIES: NAD(P)-binding protein [Ktedonobacter]|uniref:NAD(P)-binding protein n=1 Tax=Ktedonobacter TaxID=363276 RepID=UPI0019155557
MHEIASRQIDAIIIGAGLGGLLSAAHLLQRGKRVLILERLPHAGGDLPPNISRACR